MRALRRKIGRVIGRRSRESGVTLIEVMVALSILSVTLMALGGLMYQVARQTRGAAMNTYRTSALQLAESWIHSLPFDSAETAIGCTSETMGSMDYTRCVTVQQLTASRKRARIVITPTGGFATRPETLLVEKPRARRDSPFAQ